MRRGRLASAVPGGWREQFDRDGFVEVREFLPADDFKRLRSSILSGAFDARQHQQGVTITRRIPIGPRSPRESAATSRVLRDKKWNGLLSYIASTRSGPLCYAQMILIGHACGPSDPQLELQRGSLRISPEELDLLALPQPKRFAVPANTLVAIDTGGFHARGSSTRPTVRAEIWARAARALMEPDRNAPHKLTHAHRRSIGTSRSRETALEAVAALAADRILRSGRPASSL